MPHLAPSAIKLTALRIGARQTPIVKPADRETLRPSDCLSPCHQTSAAAVTAVFPILKPSDVLP